MDLFVALSITNLFGRLFMEFYTVASFTRARESGFNSISFNMIFRSMGIRWQGKTKKPVNLKLLYVSALKKF